VSAGSASIATAPGKTTITQTSQNAAINWQGFSIGKAETVQFAQPNSSSVALTRAGADPSSILGSLSANGKVFLVNPNGTCSASARRSTWRSCRIDAQHLRREISWRAATGSKARNRTVINRGTINADGGYVRCLRQREQRRRDLCAPGHDRARGG